MKDGLQSLVLKLHQIHQLRGETICPPLRFRCLVRVVGPRVTKNMGSWGEEIWNYFSINVRSEQKIDKPEFEFVQIEKQPLKMFLVKVEMLQKLEHTC